MTGVRVVEIGSGTAGPVAGMLLADAGADVLKVVRPGAHPLDTPGAPVWNRGKTIVELDLATEEGRRQLRSHLADADVLLDACAPARRSALGIDAASIADLSKLVHCSISGYGPWSSRAERSGYDALVLAGLGVMHEQPGHRPGPVFFWAPLPSYGAALLASIGIAAALRERALSGLGQSIETTLAQGTMLWTAIPWSRAERPPAAYYTTYACRGVSPTPCYEAGDGRWIHPMPEVVPAVLEILGRGKDALQGSSSGPCEDRLAYQASVQQLLKERDAATWIDAFAARDLRCQPVQSVEEAFRHPQLEAVGAVGDTVIDGRSARTFGTSHRVSFTAGASTNTEGDPAERRVDGAHGAGPLSGVTVLDFGLALAGPFASVLLSDLGAEVIRVDNVKAPRATDNQTWAAAQRGKRSITLDLKSPKGREIAMKLIQRADVVHHNMRPGVAERLGIGYEQARGLNPRIVYCHVTGFGSVGPLIDAPGSDQMSQALAGIEHAQGATNAGGRPTWNRLGMCDHAAATVSVLGVVQALARRELTGESAFVETSITNAVALLTSHVAIGEGIERWPELDRWQTGLSPRYRIYQCSDGWLCVAAIRDDAWAELCQVLGQGDWIGDPLVEAASRREPADGPLGTRLAEVFLTARAAEWVARLDAAGVPSEVVSERFAGEWFDDPELRAMRWVTDYEHPNWGRVQQAGRRWEFSRTPDRASRPPVIPGQHSIEILTELGYGDELDQLVADGVTTMP